MSRRKHAFITSTLASLALIAGLVTGFSPSRAYAADGLPPVLDNPANAVTADALPTAQINGVVWDQVVVGNTVYAAGEFTSARPAGSAVGTNESPRYNLMSYNLSTGVMTNWAPQVNGRIRTITSSPDGSRIYIGGSFTTVNGQSRSRIAAFNTSDGSLVSSFAPKVGSDVFGIAASNTVVYFGGWFGAVASQPRNRLAAVSAGDGALLDWAPAADYTVYGVGLTTAADRVVITGSFANVNGQPATSMSSIDAVSGTSFPFAVNQYVHNTGDSASLMSLKVIDDKAYTSGFWFGGTGNFEGGLIANAYDGTILNMYDCFGDTYDIAPMNGLAYMVSHHHRCDNSGGFPEQTPKLFQHSDAFTLEATGRTDHGAFNGQPSGSSVNWFPLMTPGTATSSRQSGWTVEAAGDYLLIGGEFTAVNGVSQQGLVRFGTRAVVAKPLMGPAGHMLDTAPAINSLTSTSVRVRFASDWDRDGRRLTYKVIRNDLPESQPVYTASGESSFWERPWFQFVDSNLVTGATHWYQVIATDSDGNTRYGNRTLVTVGADVPPQSAYSNLVARDGATHYWRLREAAGAPASVDYGTSGIDLAVPSAVTLGVPGAIPDVADTAATFPGTAAGMAIQRSIEPGPETFSAELWFNTTTTSGGKLLGFGNATSGVSSRYDRHVYMNDAGQVTFGVNPDGLRTITSPKTYNDGQWHHVVATVGAAGSTLWIDGRRIGTNPAGNGGEDYSGAWRLGGDYGGWVNSGSSMYFAGTIDDVAIYPGVLNQEQVREHYTATGRAVEMPPLPADAYGASVVADEPIIYWRLADTGATAEDASGNEVSGTYYNSPTQGVTSPVVADNAAVTFDGVDDVVSSNTLFNNPKIFSLEAWVNTTSTSGGKIVGFGNAQSGNSGNYDRHLYLDGSGFVRFGAYPGRMAVVTSTSAINDGQWHQVVGTIGADGMKLYVDGVLQGSDPNTGSQDYSGYWRVGGDNSWAGSPYLAGTIDEVAIYDGVLPIERVRAHYRASEAHRNAAPSVEFTTDCTGLVCTLSAQATDPDGEIADRTWDLGDGSVATGESVTHTYATSGTYSVSLTATDDVGATATMSHDVRVREPMPVPSDPYGALVRGDDPLIYWRLDDASGTVATDYSTNINDGTYRNGVTLDQPSAVVPGNSAAAFNGDEDIVSSDAKFTNPTTFSLEAWFNTTSVGGKIIGFGSAQNGRSGSYDRHIYLNNAGQPVFGVWSGAMNTITGPRALNDGQWHHVVATMDATGMAFYVDGLLVGTNPNTAISPYDGYWRLGADSTWDGSGDFDGLIDEAAVYDHSLTAANVEAHFRASATFVNQAPSAEFTTTRNGLTVTADASGAKDVDGQIVGYAWDFGDGSTATEGSATHTYAAAGSYQITLTTTDDLGATSTSTQQVTVRESLPAPSDAYGSAVTSDGPSLYWRLDEASGPTAYDVTGATRDGTYVGEFTHAITSDAVTTNPALGVTAGSFVAAVDQTVNPTTFSLEAWFKTATPGARIVGFGTSNTSASGSYDRHVYLNDAGQLVFGTWTGWENVVVSPNSYNDDQWHHVVATLGANGRILYVDGAAVASSAETGAENSTGYWRAGFDHTWSGSGMFTGSLDEIAVYGNVLSPERVAAHYDAARNPNVAPTADFTADCSGATCTLTAQASDTDGTITAYAWDFGGSGTDTGQTVTHTWPTSGTYFVTLTVTDDDGATFTVSHQVQVTVPNDPPTAAFTFAVDGLVANLDASTSTDPNGTIEAWAWDFGDGTTGSGATATHTYAASGTYPVTLTVTDDEGATAVATQNVVVVAPNVAPVAAFTATTTDLTVALDGSTSTDSDGTITDWAWDFGDGNANSGVTTSHTYAAAGTYVVTLVVTDNSGASHTTTQNVTVVAANQSPTAQFTATATELSVTLDATASGDPDGSIASYAWDFGDGATGTGVTATHTYAAAGSYTVTLTVTDDRGATASATSTVEVSAPPTTTDIAADQFGRVIADGWGSADVGGAWSVPARAGFSADGTSGIVTIPTAGQTRTARLSQVSATDMSITGEFTFDRAVTGTYIQQVWARTNGSTRYTMQLRWASDGSVRMILSRVVNGAETTLRSVNLTGFRVGAGERIAYRFDVTGSAPTNLAGTVWKVGTAEPAPQASATDATAALAGPGAVGLTMYTGSTFSNLPFTVRHDNFRVAAPGAPEPVNQAPNAQFTAATTDLQAAFDASASSDPDGTIASYAWDFGDGSTGTGVTATHTYQAAGSYTVRLVVTDNGGLTHEATSVVEPTAPPTAGVIADDTFTRTSATGWGTAEAGGAWNVDNPAAFRVDGTAGVLTIGSAGLTRAAGLPGVSAQDVRIVTDLTLDQTPTGGTYQHQLRARTDGTNFYVLTLRLLPNGTLNVQLNRQMAGASTILRSVNVANFAYQAGETIHATFEVTGTGTTTLVGTVWKGDVPPATATIQATDSTAALQRPGAVGLRAYTGAGTTSVPLNVRVDRFLVEG